MNKLEICNYALVRFLPYPEAGEFVNVGVVVHSPTSGFFDYRMMPTNATKRVRGFFPELELNLYKEALKNCEAELTRMRQEIGIAGAAAEQMAFDPRGVGLGLFRELIRPRETVIRFSGAGTARTEQPVTLLRELFLRYVRRMFAPKEYQESMMQERVSKTLKQHQLITLFREGKVGNDEYHVRFPFIHRSVSGVFSVIKPINLGQEDSTRIYEHGEMWLNRIRRLRKLSQAPDRMLFPVHSVQTKGTKQAMAASEICQELADLGAIVSSENDESRLVMFAKEAENEPQTLFLGGD